MNKSKYVIHKIDNKTLDPLQLNINGVQIEKVENVNFLGLTVNENLNWKNHVDMISNKCSKTLGILNKNNFYQPKLNYYCTIRCYYLTLCIVFWHGVINMKE